MKLSLLLLGYCGVMFAAAHAVPPADTVVLLHGLGRTRFSMMPLACALEREGYRVINATYPSRTRPLEALATEWLPAQLRAVEPGSRVHFVTHSMGGILVRLWLRECGEPANLGHVVMLAPPNAGSEIPDRFTRYAPFGWLTGVNGPRLGTALDSLPRSLGRWPAATAPLGIIAGTRTFNPLLRRALPAPHDGKVTVASTHLEGERDHLALPHSHTLLLWRRDTFTQVSAFLRDGRFARAAPAAP